jgi:hypothetical protein
LTDLGEERDHVDCEVWLGKWMDCDPGRDSALEKGMLKLGGIVERRNVMDAKGKVHYIKLANYDNWVWERQRRRVFCADRVDVFTDANKGFEALREIGRSK